MQGRDGETSPKDGSVTPNQPQGGIAFLILGWIFFVISIFFLPAFFGAGAILMGTLVRKRGREKHGLVMIILGVVGLVIGFTLGAIGGGTGK